MTKDELKRVVHLCTRDFKEFNIIMDAVEAYLSASITNTPVSTNSTTTTSQTEGYFTDNFKTYYRDKDGNVIPM